MSQIKYVITLCVAMLFTLAAACPADLPRLHATQDRIVDPSDKTVFLHGVNLGNWLLIESGGLGGSMGRFNDQYTLFTTFKDRFGEDERWRLINIYRDNWITPRDFDNAKQFGFNFLRLGFDYELLEDDAHPMQLRPGAFKYLDFAVAHAKAHGMYILIDLHGAQERQVSGRQGGRAGYTRFWIDPKAQERSLWMWREIEKHFKGNSTVMGYEALNEPFSAKPAELKDYCVRWYKQLREVDADTIAVFPGHNKGIEFYGSASDNGWSNAVMDMHFYPGSFIKATATQPVTPVINTKFIQLTIPKWVDRMRTAQMPLLIGEMNPVYKEAGGGEMARRYFDFAQEHNWAISYWTLKELTPAGGPHERIWSLTTNADPIPPVDIHTSSKEEIEAGFKSLSTMRLMTEPDLLHWLTTDEKPRPLGTGSTTETTTAPTGEQPQQ